MEAESALATTPSMALHAGSPGSVQGLGPRVQVLGAGLGISGLGFTVQGF